MPNEPVAAPTTGRSWPTATTPTIALGIPAERLRAKAKVDLEVKLEGTREFNASLEVVWSVIDDPTKMANTMPGVESFEVTNCRHWSAKVKAPLGLAGLKMSISFEKLEERPPEFASLRAKGQGVGALMNMTTSFTLSGDGEKTSMKWDATVKIAGPVGSMGHRVLQPIMVQQVGNALAALEREVEAAKSAV